MKRKLKQFLLHSLSQEHLTKVGKKIVYDAMIVPKFTEQTHAITGNSALVEVASTGLKPIDWYFQVNGETKVTRRNLRVSGSLFVVDFKLDNGKEHALSAEAVLNGFYYDRVDAETGETIRGYATFLSWSNAQARTLRAVFADSTDSRNMVIRGLGVSPYLFATSLGNGIYKMDADKWAKRLGLFQTTSHKLNLNLGNRVIDLGNGEYKLVGRDALTIYVVNDCYSVVNQGKYRVFDKDSKQLVERDAAEYPFHRKVGDGMALCSSRFADLVEAQGFSRNHQARLNPANKMMTIECDEIRSVWPDADLVMPASCVKGKLKQFLSKHKNEKMQYRIANQTQPQQTMRNMVYQFVNSMLITSNGLMKAFSESMNWAEEALLDQDTMLKLIGVTISELDRKEIESDEESDLTTRTMATRLQGILTQNPEAYRDLFVVEEAHSLLKKITEKWVSGTAPVRAQYKFLVDDPLAIVDAYQANNRDQEGNYLVPDQSGLAYGECVYFNTHGEYHHSKVAIGRAPCVTHGEVQRLNGSTNPVYQNRGWEGLLILNVHDFSLMAMGGADCDGDIGMVMEHLALIVASEYSMTRSPIVDEGCPYKSDQYVDFSFTFTDTDYARDPWSVIDKMYVHIRRYVAASLKANKIGLLSNRASLFLNGLSANIAHSQSKTDKGKEVNRMLLKHVDLLRLCTGWEIDSVKHGGAFWNSLNHELAFVKDPKKAPSMLTEWKDKSCKYIDPAWFTYNKLMKANVASQYRIENATITSSVIDQVHVQLYNWRNGLVNKIESKMEKMLGQEIVPNSMMADIISSYGKLDESAMVNQNLNVLCKELLNLATQWQNERSNLTAEITRLCDKIIKDDDIRKYDQDTVIKLRKRNVLRSHLAKNYAFLDEFYAGQANGIQERYALSDVAIAYVGYLATYREYRGTRINRFRDKVKGRKLYKFVWHVLADKMQQLLALTNNSKPIHVDALSDRVLKKFRVIMPRKHMLDAESPITIEKANGQYNVIQSGKVQGNLVIYHMPMMSGIDSMIVDPIRVTLTSDSVKSEMITYEVICE